MDKDPRVLLAEAKGQLALEALLNDSSASLRVRQQAADLLVIMLRRHSDAEVEEADRS